MYDGCIAIPHTPSSSAESDLSIRTYPPSPQEDPQLFFTVQYSVPSSSPYATISTP